MAKLFLALVHYPIYNKRMDVVATAITNLDVHDIARSSCTYGLDGYFIVHPAASQQEIVKEITSYWQDGYGAAYNPDRKTAIELVRIQDSLASVIEAITSEEGQVPLVVATDARLSEKTMAYQQLRQHLEREERPILLLFGTGWGLAKTVMEQVDSILRPIFGPVEYNHLSVRSAVAIILDRLRGEAWFSQDQ